jgi:signal transduction histidine kinase
MAPGLPKMERDRFDLGEVVEEKVKSISRTTENPIQVEAIESLHVDGDRQRMGDVVAHLLENAIRYSPPGASIEVQLRCMDRAAVVSVRDHGPGIPPERQPHVFEPLYEPLPPGATGYTGVVGLGLHLSWQIIEAHGGRIWLESAQGEGTTFCFSLPLGEVEVQYASA